MIFTCPCAWIEEASGGIFGLGGCLVGSVKSHLDMDLRHIVEKICAIAYLFVNSQ